MVTVAERCAVAQTFVLFCFVVEMGVFWCYQGVTSFTPMWSTCGGSIVQTVVLVVTEPDSFWSFKTYRYLMKLLFWHRGTNSNPMMAMDTM